MATTGQKLDHISEVRKNATALLDTIANLDALRKDWDYLSLATALTDADCAPLTVAEIAAVYTTLAAINSLLAQGHGTNLAKVQGIN